MRITTQMLNRSAQKAGLPTNRTSLLNHIRGNNSNVSLANALSKTNKGADATKKSDYEKLEKSADQTAASADKLLSAGSEKATASDVQSFVDKYNDLLQNLGKSSDTLNLFYAQAAKDTVKEYKQELAELGITVAKDGTLSFSRTAFEKYQAQQGTEPSGDNAAGEGAAAEAQAAAGSTAETGTEESKTEETADTAADSAARLNALIFKEGGFFSKMSYLASRVSDFADANAESYSGYYDAAGFKTNPYSSGRYNFWS